MPPLSGIKPMAEKLCMNFADLAATTMSHARAMFAPAPAATPLTRAMTGWGKPVSVRISGSRLVSTVMQIDQVLVSGHGPVAKVLAGAETAARASKHDHPRVADCSSTSRSSACICAVKLLSLSGRLSVMRAIGPSSWKSMVS